MLGLLIVVGGNSVQSLGATTANTRFLLHLSLDLRTTRINWLVATFYTQVSYPHLGGRRWRSGAVVAGPLGPNKMTSNSRPAKDWCC